MLFLQDKLYSCGLRHPTHELEVTKCEEMNTAKRVEPEVSFFFKYLCGGDRKTVRMSLGQLSS